jgi:hypothetical protein
MSNQFTEPSISGYNATPPTDDGAATSNNEVEWAKHKDKLGDPLKNYSDAIKSSITTAFALNILNAVVTKSAGYTAVAGDRGKLFDVSNTVTIDLLASATAGNGFILAFRNAGSGVVTIDGNSAETINGSATLVLQVGGWAILTSDGTNWSGLIGGPPNEGSWTPVIWDASLSDAEGQVYGGQVGDYIKIGNHVFITGTVYITDLGTLTIGDNANIGGLPFTSVTGTFNEGAISVGTGLSLNITAGYMVAGYIDGNSNFIKLTLWDAAAGVSNLTIEELSVNAYLTFHGHYIAV